MRAWLMDSYDGVEKLRLGEVPIRTRARSGLTQIEVRGAESGRRVSLAGHDPAKPALPHILGRDGVGDVVKTGPGVTGFNPGKTVGILRCDAGVSVWGTLADMVVVPAASLAPIPSGWSLEQATAAPLVFLTSWQALTQWSDPPAPAAKGSVLLVTGASGGVGTASVQLGKSMGLTVVALSRSAEKRAKLLELGADFAFDPADAGLRKAVMTAIARRKWTWWWIASAAHCSMR